MNVITLFFYQQESLYFSFHELQLLSSTFKCLNSKMFEKIKLYEML